MRARAREGGRRGSARTPVLGAPQQRVAGPGRGPGELAGCCGRPGAQTFPRRLREQKPRGRAGQPCRTGLGGAAPTGPPLGSRRGDTRRRPWNRRGEVAHLEGPASPRALRRAGSPRCLPGGRGLCGAARGRGDLESPLHRALLAKEEGAAQRGARLGPRAGAGRCARPEREAEGQPASGSCGPGGRPTPRVAGAGVAGGCSSAVPPRFPTAPASPRGRPATVGAQPFFGGSGLGSSRRRRPGFPACSAACSPPGLQPGSGDKPWDAPRRPPHGNRAPCPSGPWGLRFRAGSTCCVVPSVGVGLGSPWGNRSLRTRAAPAACVRPPYAHIENLVPSRSRVAEPSGRAAWAGAQHRPRSDYEVIRSRGKWQASLPSRSMVVILSICLLNVPLFPSFPILSLSTLQNKE